MSKTTYYKGRIDYAIGFPDDSYWKNFYNYGDYYTFTALPSKFLRSYVRTPIKIEPYYGSQIKVTYIDNIGNTITHVDTFANTYNYLKNNVFTDLIYTESMYGDITFYYDGNDDKDLIDLFIGEMVFPDENTIILYLLNSPRNKVTKDLIIVGGVTGNFPRAISKRNIMLDLTNIETLGDFNYVYVSLLNRYYYVKDLSFIKDYATVNLIEDVLMSFDSLIRSQSAYVERNENTYDDDKVDSLVTYDYDKSITVTDITPTNDIYAKTDTSITGGGYYALKVVG